jgi:cytoskeleton protein RodZ
MTNFKAAREAQGLTLEDVFQRTRISVQNLQAIEALDFEAMPPPIYARTFIRQYGQLLGIDTLETLAQYDSYLGGTRNPPSPREKPKHRRLPRLNYRIFATVASIFAVVFMIILVSLYQRGDVEVPRNPLPEQQSTVPGAQETPPPPALVTAQPTAEAVKPGDPLPSASRATALDQNEPLPEAPAEKPRKTVQLPSGEPPYRISIVAREETWLRISSGEEQPFQTHLEQGERIERQMNAPFVLDLENAGAVDVLFQDTPLGTLGKPGEAVRLFHP